MTTPDFSACKCSDTGLKTAPEGAPIIALIGAPNSGKSTLFNGLTGARVQMGNWPGTSVEISRGAWGTYDLIDFPGAYSLDAHSPDEAFTRAMIVEAAPEDRPDVVMVAVDAASLERGLYMVAQLLESPHRVVVVVTKSDVAADAGQSLDVAALSAATGCPVVAVDPRHRRGLDQVENAIAVALAREPWRREAPASCCVDELELIDDRYAWIENATAKAMTVGEAPKSTLTEKIDRFALHPVAGPLLFLAVMWVVFQITTTVAAPIQDAVSGFFEGPLSDWTSSLLGLLHIDSSLVRGLLIDGLIVGVGTVLSFAPLMALMFLCLAVLEDSGYMARAAVVTDRVMKAIGLPGKAFIPIVVGFGCNVPAISSTRVLSQRDHRIMTALLVPFASCSARLTVYAMLGATFFPGHSGTVVFAMYVISIALIVCMGWVFRRLLWRTLGTEALVIDLPVYQIPGLRLAASVTWTRVKGFLQTAGGIIVICVAAVFALQSTPVTSGYSFADEDLPVAESAYGEIASAVAPVFKPAGFDNWSISGTLVTGFIAKEAVISTWAQTYALEDPSDESTADQGSSALAGAIREDFDTASGGHSIAAIWAFMVFLLAYTPCVATMAALKREIGWKWTFFAVGVELTTAWVLAVAVFNVLRVWF
ncbi:ferrous iron transport protein B [Corynebacterium vitaeruminis]|uniref:ferrous iron transport protein B n=1 Tax=Corynebacterium vitaeruminis TaxID=38305 RepID=UPI00055757B2|nr:ferrous iron transport protein B [Corynebacterium vitaeruminis]